MLHHTSLESVISNAVVIGCVSSLLVLKLAVPHHRRFVAHGGCGYGYCHRRTQLVQNGAHPLPSMLHVHTYLCTRVCGIYYNSLDIPFVYAMKKIY
jgi:hypothetical protein